MDDRMMKATLTVEYPLPSQIVERLAPQSVHQLYDDAEASAALQAGSDKARRELDAAAKRLGLRNESSDTHYGFSGARSWAVWYQRVYS